MVETLHEIYDRKVSEDGLIPDPEQEAVLSYLETIRKHLNTIPEKRGLKGLFSKSPEPPKGLYLWGGVGTGKSMLMDLFARSVTAPKRRVHFHAFMQEIQSGLHEARKTGVDDAIKPVAEAVAADLRLLAFDEMQITDIADAMIVGRLFERLFEAGVIVVTTSNRHPDDLYKEGLNRKIFLPFIELLKTNMEVHELDAARDYRQDRLAGSPVFFHPVDAVARTAIDELWQELTAGESERLVLFVKGRQVELPEFHNGVARTSFWSLCGQPLGPADYLALADAVKVLILEGVPRLSSENYNQARRFVTLIDALYEAKVRLVMSAADTPENLYIEGEGVFEFERTASRLREMQGEGWGA